MQVSLQAEVRGARGGPPLLRHQLRPLPSGVRPPAASHELDGAGAGQDEQDHHQEEHQGRGGPRHQVAGRHQRRDRAALLRRDRALRLVRYMSQSRQG